VKAWLRRLAWRTNRRRSTADPPFEHPGADEPWPDYPAVRNQHGRNPQARQDEDESRWTP
jgi:hypothetical protein